MSLRRRFLSLLAISLAALLAGCKISSINYFPPHPASVRVINLMTDGSSIDIAVNGTAAFSAVGPEQLTSYQSYDNQTTQFTVTLTGTTRTLQSFSIALAGEQPYTLVVFGTAAQPSATMLSEVARAPTNGNIQLAVFNAAINNAYIDIYVTAPGADITQLNPNFGAVAFSGTSLNLAFTPGTYQIQVTQGGTKTVIFDSGGTALTPNVALSFIAYSRGSGTLVNAAVLQSQGPGGYLPSIFTRVKASNAGDITIGNVDQLLGTLLQNGAIAYNSASSYFQGPQGVGTINFQASAVPGAVIASVPATLVPANDYSAFLVGPAGAQQAYLLKDLNVPPVNVANMRVRFVNAMYGGNPVNAAIGSTSLAAGVAYSTASGYSETAATTGMTVAFTDTASGSPLFSFSQDFVAYHTYTIYLTGVPSGPSAIVTLDN